MSAVMEGTAAFDRVLTGHIGILISTMSRLVEAATGKPASTERTQLIAIAILNQMMSASMSQPLVLARLDHRQINEDITRIMAENITRAVLGMLQLPDVTHLPTDTPGK